MTTIRADDENGSDANEVADEKTADNDGDTESSDAEGGDAENDDAEGSAALEAEPAPSAQSEDSEESDEAEASAPEKTDKANGAAASNGNGDSELEEVEVESQVETVGGDEADDEARRRAIMGRRYKIQEVIKRRQVLLVQVTKEERGNKGAALTTYLSLAGRYCVLMPNTNKGGGISRKIANVADRRRLKKITSELSVPEGMAVIVRTAGSQRSKVEIRRDYEYLLRLWDQIREGTLQSNAPSLIHEEANLIMRSVRDLYSRDMDKILVDGEEGYKTAKSFMKSLMPSHARKVQLFKEQDQPLFRRFKVERQLDEMHSASVQLASGGYIVLNSTEALVAIDVNSGRATKERHIEETALKTNLEAASEVARQLRLRDLAGLIVVDFIDMMGAAPQSRRRAPPQGSHAPGSRAHPARPNLALRSARDVSPEAAPELVRKLDRQLPAMPRSRLHSQHRFGGLACSAGVGGGRLGPQWRQGGGDRAHGCRLLHPESETRSAARYRETLRLHRRDRSRRRLGTAGLRAVAQRR